MVNNNNLKDIGQINIAKLSQRQFWCITVFFLFSMYVVPYAISSSSSSMWWVLQLEWREWDNCLYTASCHLVSFISSGQDELLQIRIQAWLK